MRSRLRSNKLPNKLKDAASIPARQTARRTLKTNGGLSKRPSKSKSKSKSKARMKAMATMGRQAMAEPAELLAEPEESNAVVALHELVVHVQACPEVEPAVEVEESSIVRATKLAMAPIRGAVWTLEQVVQWLEERLSQKLDGAKAVTPPRPELAVPIVDALRIKAHHPTLRELFLNLLATGMNAEKRDQAHPAYVEILKCLSVEDAELLAFIAMNPIYPFVTLETPFGRRVWCEMGKPSVDESALVNLRRLQLMEFEPSVKRFPSPDDMIEFGRQRLEGTPDGDHYFQMRLGRISVQQAELTAFGKLFCNACEVGGAVSTADFRRS